MLAARDVTLISGATGPVLCYVLKISFLEVGIFFTPGTSEWQYRQLLCSRGWIPPKSCGENRSEFVTVGAETYPGALELYEQIYIVCRMGIVA